MGTFKKKDIKKINVDELVDPDGSFIDGDESHETTSQIKTAPQQTTDKYAKTAKQNLPWPYYGYMGTPYSHGQRGGIGDMYEEAELDEAEMKMAKMVEDILTKKLNQKGIVNKQSNFDVNRNQIPDLEELSTKFNKQDIASNIKTLISNIQSNELGGEEKAIIINYIVQSIGTENIEPDYKNIIKSSI